MTRRAKIDQIAAMIQVIYRVAIIMMAALSSLKQALCTLLKLFSRDIVIILIRSQLDLKSLAYLAGLFCAAGRGAAALKP
jgi:hypothetical protein